MRVILRLLIICACLAAPCGAYADSPKDPKNPLQQLVIAVDAARKDDCKTASPIFVWLMASPRFSELNAQQRAVTFGLAGVCRAHEGSLPDAHSYALRATKEDPSLESFWDFRLSLELTQKKFSEAVITVEGMALNAPTALNATPMRSLFMLNRELKKAKLLASQATYLKILTGTAYQPLEIGASSDPFRSDYAALLVGSGDVASARKLIADIINPELLLAASFDPRLRNYVPKDFDLRRAFEGRVTSLGELSASHLNSLSVVVDRARVLRILGRPNDALAVLKAADPASPANKFSDIGEMENWWWDGVARSNQMLGRYDDAIGAYRSGVDASEAGTLNVSQMINLGHLQVRFGKYEDALATVIAFEKEGRRPSPYGEMELRLVRVCALSGLGRTEAAKADHDYALEHEMDGRNVAMESMLCVGDFDAAAAIAIRRLNDPDEQASALIALSDYDQPPSGYPQSPSSARIPALKARPDVQAAIKRAGGVRRLHVQSNEL